MPSTITFNCDLCGTKRTERFCWYKKRSRHFCSRLCANRSNAQIKATGLNRKEYEKQYWSKPENKARRKKVARKNFIKRTLALGDSFKKMMLNRCKDRAKNKGIDFNLTIEDIVVPEFCPILNIELKPFNKQGGSYNSPSLDRIDNSKGYVKGNVQVISKRANLIKADATVEEILLVAEYLKKLSPLP